MSNKFGLGWLASAFPRIIGKAGAVAPTPPEIGDFRVLFTGSTASFEALSRMYAKLAITMQALANSNEESKIGHAVLRAEWIDFLSEQAFSHLTDEGSWRLEDILHGILSAEYELKEIVFLDGQGHIRYKPWAFPFSLDPLKALIEAFGLEVCGDTFWDGYCRLNGLP